MKEWNGLSTSDYDYIVTYITVGFSPYTVLYLSNTDEKVNPEFSVKF